MAELARSTALAPLVLPAERPWLEGVVYDSATRYHLVNRCRVLSVTEVLHLSGKTDFSQVKPDVLQRKGRIGTAAHLAAHFYDEGDLVESSVDDAVAPYMGAWRLFREYRGFIPDCLETVIFSRTYGYIGRLDRVGRVRGHRRRVLLDIKTGDPDAARADLQTVAYELALLEECPELVDEPVARWSVHLKADGTYRVAEYPAPGRTWRIDKAEFLEAMRDAQALQGLTWRAPTVSTLHLVHPSSDEARDPVLPLDINADEPPPPDDEPPPPSDEEDPPPSPTELVHDILPEPSTATAMSLARPVPSLPQTDDSLIQTRDLVVSNATDLAAAVSDQPTCQAAIDYAVVIDDWIKAAHAHFDPRVAQSHAVWKRDCEDRRVVVEPLEHAKELLIGRTGAVTKWIAEERRKADEERRRLQAEADKKAADERAKAEAERMAAEAERRKAIEAGDRERAAEASRAAVEAEQRKGAAVAEVIQAPVAAPVTGVTPKSDWTGEVHPAGAEGLLELVKGIARRHVLKEVIARVREVPQWETATAVDLINILELFVDEAPQIPVTAVEANAMYLRTRAKADKDTLNWPGVRFYDRGQTAIKPRARR